MDDVLVLLGVQCRNWGRLIKCDYHGYTSGPAASDASVVTASAGREPPFDAALFIIHAERGSLMLGVGGTFVILNSNSFTA